MERNRRIAIILFCAIIPTFLIPFSLDLIPNLFDLVTAVIAGGMIALTGSGIAFLYRGSRTRGTDLVSQSSNIKTNIGIIKEPSTWKFAFTKVQAHLFYPWYYWYFPFSRFFKRNLNHIPRYKLIVNHNINPPKAYWMGSFATSLVIARKVEWFSEKKEDLFEWCNKRQYHYNTRHAEEGDLLEGTSGEMTHSL